MYYSFFHALQYIEHIFVGGVEKIGTIDKYEAVFSCALSWNLLLIYNHFKFNFFAVFSIEQSIQLAALCGLWDLSSPTRD